MSLSLIQLFLLAAARRSSDTLTRLEHAITRLERHGALHPEPPEGVPSLQVRLDAARDALVTPFDMDLERSGGDVDADGMPNKDKARMVQHVLGVVSEAVDAAPISTDCRAVTMHKIRALHSITNDITGELADQAYTEHREAQKADAKKGYELASTLLRWRMDLGEAYESFRESQWGKPEAFKRKRREVAQAAAARLPDAFEDFHRWATTHPELRPVLGDDVEVGLPSQLDIP